MEECRMLRANIPSDMLFDRRDMFTDKYGTEKVFQVLQIAQSFSDFLKIFLQHVVLKLQVYP